MLGNGMTVACLRDESAPVVATALWYRAGTAHEPGGQEGVAHFVEHMMFRGSARFGPGEIDRLTQAVGGSNNAYTSHDSTVYVFGLPRDHWRLALEVEADRMAGLRWDPAAFEAERSVILEEIAEVEDDPWDALELAVLDAFHGDHAYGRRILGRKSTVTELGADELAAFHRSACAPDRAVLTVAGAVPPEILVAAEDLFSPLEAALPLAPIECPTPPTNLRRVRVRRGETRRGLLALPGPAAAEADFVYLRLALTALCGGRASPLQRLLVDEGELCRGVSSALTETVHPGTVTLALELLPGVDEEAVERVLWDELARARHEGLDEAAVERGRRLLLSDWLFSHETIELRGAALGAGLALFGADHARTQLGLLTSVSPADVERAARRYLDPERGGVMGWAGP